MAGLSRLQAAAPGQTVSGSDHDPRAVGVARACVEHAGPGGVVGIAPRRRGRAPRARRARPRGRQRALRRAPRPARRRRGPHAAARRAAARRLRRLARRRAHRQPAPGPDDRVCPSSATRRCTTGRSSARWRSSRWAPQARRPAPATRGRPRRAASARDAVRSSAAAQAPGRAGASAAGRAAPPAARLQTVGARGWAPRGPARPPGMLTGGAEQFANRLHKNMRRLGRQLRREDITCYRLYDADLPDYNLVIDVYGDWVHVQEYAPPAEIDPGKVRAPARGRARRDRLRPRGAAGARGAQGAPPPARRGAIRAPRNAAAISCRSRRTTSPTSSTSTTTSIRASSSTSV